MLARQAVLFDPDFTYPAYDDIELGYRLERQGMRLHYRPLAVTCHHHEMTPESFAARQRNAGRMAVVFARKHPELGRGVLEVEAILASGDRPSPALLTTVLQCLEEVEKVRRQFEKGIITEEQARVSRQKNVITRAVGSREYVQVDTRSFPVFEGDRFLLCSDGLHGYLEPFEIGSLMDGSIDVVVERAIGLANQRGGRDNITAIAVELRA